MDAKETVLAFINAMNAEDFAAARKYTADDLQFVGVMGSRDSADAYFDDMKKMKFKYDVKKAFSDGNDVCLMYDITMNGKVVFCCGWYVLEEGKINWFRVVFDPRPIL